MQSTSCDGTVLASKREARFFGIICKQQSGLLETRKDKN